MKEQQYHTDLHLLQTEISKGNEAAFTSLYGVMHNRLMYFAHSLVHAADIARDVVEDVFVELWKNRSNIGKIDNITIYLYTAVKNRSLSRLSVRAKELITQPFDTLDVDIASVTSDPYSLAITGEMLRKVDIAIEQLPPRCKLIFKLVREDRLKYKEIAQILGISVNTIDAQMAIAVKRLCEALNIKTPDKKPTALLKSFSKKKLQANNNKMNG